MAKEENRGGNLTNKEIEEDLKVTGKQDGQGGYIGSQDTGDRAPRSMGTEVQKNDGLISDEKDGEKNEWASLADIKMTLYKSINSQALL